MKAKFYMVLPALTGMIFCTNANAQTKRFVFGIYGEALFATESFSPGYDNGFGGGADFNYRFAGRFSVTGTAGYLHFHGKDLIQGIPSPNMNFIPVRAGLKYQFPLVYLKLETGAVTNIDDGRISVSLSPGIGARILSFDVQARYEHWLNYRKSSYAGIKMGINF
jgi:hypothetical protein